jgi:TrmH family RNA methyltransferase
MDIQDPGNMGTILRNAKAFGYNDVVISHDCVDIYNEKVLKSSMGVIFYLNIYSCNVYQYLLDDKRSIITTFLDEPNNAPVVLKHNLVLGNEGHGIDLEIKDLKHSNYVIDIEFESLNVAVASGIIMNELRR